MRLLPSIPILALILLTLAPSSRSSQAQAGGSARERMVIQVIQLDYADAEHLASVLAPLLSPEGKVVAYGPTNCLILRDRESIVKRVVEIVKGPSKQDE